MDLKDLYRDVIVDHNRNPRNFRAMPDADRKAEGFNPLCGDKLTLYREARRTIASTTSRSTAAGARSRSLRRRC